MTETPFIEYAASVEQELSANVEIIRHMAAAGKMHFDLEGTPVGFVSHHELDRICDVSARYQPVFGTIADKEVVLYDAQGVIGFGLYDEKHDLCFPVSIRELVRTWVDDPEPEHREKLQALLEDVELVIAHPSHP